LGTKLFLSYQCRTGCASANRTEARISVVRKQYHFWPSKHGRDAWDVDRLIELSRKFPVVDVPLTSIGEVDSVYWIEDGFGDLTVRRVVEHMKLVQDVDPSYPIILGADGRVMDGMHRVARALLEGRTTIPAVRFDVDPEPDFLDCSPEDLPY
jgi:hypothetical protein